MAVGCVQIPFSRVSTLARECGFADVGVSRARPADEVAELYRQWLAMGHHGEMQYLERNLEKRLDPQLLVPGAKSIISLIMPYAPKRYDASYRGPRIASYAFLKDYHLTLKERLFLLLDSLRQEFGEINGRAFVDSAPFLDRFWASNAGLGWIGKNTLLISPQFGSYFFIGSLVLDRDFETTERLVASRCGSCDRCQTACPAKAFVSPGVMDARKCISYLTIEKKTPLTRGERKVLGDWVFGCDACQLACPWNQRALRKGLAQEPLVDMSRLRKFCRGKLDLPKDSPMTRANADQLRELLRLAWEKAEQESIACSL